MYFIQYHTNCKKIYNIVNTTNFKLDTAIKSNSKSMQYIIYKYFCNTSSIYIPY